MSDFYCAFCDLPPEALHQRMSEALSNEETVGICSHCRPRLTAMLESMALPLVRHALADPTIEKAICSAVRAGIAQIMSSISGTE
jgi:hypothetical protein